MNTIKITIRGTTPLLQNRFTDAAMLAVESGTSRTMKGDKGSPREQAEPKTYRDNKGRFTIPGPNVFRCIIDAGKYTKVGKSKATTTKSSIIPSFSSVATLDCVLTDHDGAPLADFEVDSRAVVIPSTGGRIMAHRPRFDAWQVTFDLELDTRECDAKTMRRLIDDAGSKVGIGDFRPDRKGPFGKFVVVGWEDVK
jgi:hypothetical protein